MTFRLSVYRACLRFLESYWRGRKSKDMEVAALRLAIQDNRLHWWKKEGLPKPSGREAHIAAEVFKQAKVGGSDPTNFRVDSFERET